MSNLDAGRRAYRAMHWGKPAGRSRRVVGPRGIPAVTVELGRFVDLELSDGRVWPDTRLGERLSADVWLATDDSGRHLYFLAEAGFRPGPGAPVGSIAAISYRADKNDGLHTYRHAFGEGASSGELPALAVDSEGFAIIVRRRSRFRVEWRGIVG